MDRLKIINIKNDDGKTYVSAQVLGSAEIGECYMEALEYLRTNHGIDEVRYDFNECHLRVGLGVSYNDYYKDYQKQLSQRAKELEEKRKAWEQSPAGQAELKRIEEEKKAHDEFVYHNSTEPLLALLQINPADLSSGKTSINEAVRLCREVMTVLLKCEDLKFSNEEQKEMSDILKGLGCVKYNDANSKFLSSEPGPLAESMRAVSNIEFPLSVFSNIIDVNGKTFNYAMERATEGGMEGSWIGQWLKTQQQAEEEIQFE